MFGLNYKFNVWRYKLELLTTNVLRYRKNVVNHIEDKHLFGVTIFFLSFRR